MANGRIRVGIVDHRYFIGGSDALIIVGEDEAAPLPLGRDIRSEAEPEDLSLVVATRDPGRRWHEATADRMPIGWRVVAVCCATAAFLLVEWPWNFLPMLLLFPIRNARVRFYTFPTVAAKGSMGTRECYWRGSPT
jgi:hypothetical protein